jgi:tetratricopeptide (TPR) repeat protein
MINSKQSTHNLLIVTLIILFSLTSGKMVSAAPSAPVDLKPILLSTRNADAASSADIKALLKLGKGIDTSSADWPVYTFLMGEVFLLRGEKGNALDRYESIINRASSHSRGDDWGESGLVTASFWRLLSLLSSHEEKSGDISAFIDNTKSITGTRFARRMFHAPVLDSLPKLEEEILRMAALLAWQRGKKDQAQRLFIDYLTISSSALLSPEENNILNHVLSSGMASPDHISLLRGKRLYTLRMFDKSRQFLLEAGKSKSPEVKAEAYFYLSDINRIKGGTLSESIELLGVTIKTSHNPELLQRSLFQRAILFRRKGKIQLYLNDLARITNEFSGGKLIDDVLYELARYYQYRSDFETSLKYFTELRSLKGPNDWINMSRFQPAMILYSMGKPDDLQRAVTLLKEMDELMPFGPLRFNVHFWLGRILEEKGNLTEAKNHFELIIKERPFHYYSIRARMHLRSGNKARKEVWPDESTQKELRTTYEKSKLDNAITSDSSYHHRLSNALQTGLYATTFDEYNRLRQKFPTRRLEELSLRELDDSGMFTPVCLLLSLRQDALAAKDIKRGSSIFADNFLLIANAVGNKGGDWPLSMHMVIAGGEPLKQKSAIQRSDGYLVTAFPPAFKDSINRKGEAYNVKPELLYSIARRESLFYPSALSKRGALGLFQFIPSTFRALDRDELLKRQKGNVLLAIMEHNAGYGAVRSWTKYWKESDRMNDVEYMIETVRFAETRIFARRVLTDIIITDAIGVLRSE